MIRTVSEILELETSRNIFNYSYRTFGTQLRASGPGWSCLDDGRDKTGPKGDGLKRWLGSPVGVALFPSHPNLKKLEFHIWFGKKEDGLKRSDIYAEDMLRALTPVFPGCVTHKIDPDGRGVLIDIRIPYEDILIAYGLPVEPSALAALNADFFDRMLKAIHPVVISKLDI